ncbi:SRPBCC family protein [Chiayiivirga flava]|uniref:Uncharacterized protein YndB with AHSA1/START domain n=1 Tax=Chiayiivirga flava TaxID=659595 RepID=A0A7W8D5J0_9GAMM|nr:SRPBCC family protein [Chiayiivirga flava]MBB5207927.1 uncharacterized protein YndB with AHSA1/START domain [Chiayiivirga flava]
MTALENDFGSDFKVSPETLFAALTDPDALRAWFAESVDVDARPDGRFRFWGRHTYAVPTRTDATQQLLAFEPPHRLVFTWPMHGETGTVELLLAPGDADTNPGGTRLRAVHRFARAPAIGRAKELVDDLWRLYFGNLQAWLDGGAAISRPDFTDPDPRVTASILIDAPRERVFASFLDPASLDRWIASAAQVEPHVGGRYSYGWNYRIGERDVAGGPSRILELVENEKLVTDWPDWRGDPDMPPQRITWLFASEGSGTRVTLVHEGFTRAADISDYPFGWAFFLGMLPKAFTSDAA